MVNLLWLARGCVISCGLLYIFKLYCYGVIHAHALETSCRGHDQIVRYWKQKLDPTAIIRKDVDCRGIAGLENAIQRYEDEGGKIVLVAALQNLLKTIKLAQTFQKSKMASMDSEEMRKALVVFHEEGVQLPLEKCSYLLGQKVDMLMAEGAYSKVLDTLNYFKMTQGFELLNPSLASLECSLANKQETFTSVVFEKLLLPWIQRGSEGQGQVLGLAQEAVAVFGSIDYVELPPDASKAWNEQMNVWRSILALLSNEIIMDYVERPLACLIQQWLSCIVMLATLVSCICLGYVLTSRWLVSECHDHESTPQEDVEELLKARGKSNSNVLTLLAATMDSSPWWKEQLDQCQLEVPGLHLHAGTVVEFAAELDEMKDLTEGVGKRLLEMTEQIAEISATVRKCKIESLLRKLLAKNKAYVNMSLNLPAESGQSSKHHLQASQRLLHGCVAQWPEDADVASLDEKVSLKLQSVGALAKVSALLDAIADVGATLDDPPELGGELQSAIDKLNGAVEGVPPCQDLQEQEKEAIQKTWDSLLNLLATHFCGGDLKLKTEAMERNMASLRKMPSIGSFATEETDIIIDHVEAVCSLVVKSLEFKPLCALSHVQYMARDSNFEMLKSIRRCLQALHASTKKVNDANSQKFTSVATVVSHQAKPVQAAEQMVKALGDGLVMKAKQEFQKHMQELAHIGGGRKEGKMWSEEVKENATWASIEKCYTQKKLFDVDPKELALSALHKILEVMSLAMDPQEQSDASALKKLARVTKCSGCLLHTLCKPGKAANEVLHTAVQSELRELRNALGTKAEQTLLHPALWSKVSQVLKGKLKPHPIP
eukprot:6492462-Amphidinium_carterae.1